MEFMISLVDYTSADPDLAIALHKAGDVIEVLPDGADWGKEPPNNPDWILVKVPNISQAESDGFNAPELPDTLRPLQKTRRRQFVFDITGLTAVRRIRNFHNMTAAVFRLRMALKARLP